MEAYKIFFQHYGDAQKKIIMDVPEVQEISHEDIKSLKNSGWPVSEIEKMKVLRSDSQSNRGRQYIGFYPSGGFVCWTGNVAPDYGRWKHRQENPVPSRTVANAGVSLKSIGSEVDPFKTIHGRLDDMQTIVDSNLEGLSLGLQNLEKTVEDLKREVNELKNDKKRKAEEEVLVQDDFGTQLPRFQKKKK